MKPTNILQQLKNLVFIQLKLSAKSLISLGILTLIAVWLFSSNAPPLHLNFLASAEKRFYFVAFLFLCWIIKFYVFAEEDAHFFKIDNKFAKVKLKELQQRFNSMLGLLKKVSLKKLNQRHAFKKLPLYLIVGPNQSGKTTFLANSGIKYVLQKRLKNEKIESSDHCDWWVTKESILLDVPGKYLAINSEKSKTNINRILWRYLLHLIRKHRGKHGVSGIILTLSLAEIIQDGDSNKFQSLLDNIFQCLGELQHYFACPIPCRLVITKCDKFPGFNEFFSETSYEESNQVWGVSLPTYNNPSKAYGIFGQRFDVLIKKLNKQLLWRLHHEHNPMAKPLIKDFPLVMERVKEFSLEFIKAFSTAHLPLSLNGVYFTSALQVAPGMANQIIEQPADLSKSVVQIFKEPSPTSRAYFIRQLILQELDDNHISHSPFVYTLNWRHFIAYATAISAVALSIAMLGSDFEQGVKQTYAVQNNFVEYENKIAQLQDPNDQFLNTIVLLNKLHQTVKDAEFKFDLKHLLTFYSNKAQQKANKAYNHALASILLPELKSYTENYLKFPVNKKAELVYDDLKTYLMLGDFSKFDINYIANTLQKIRPKNISQRDINDFMYHLRKSLEINWQPMPLNQNLIQETRKYLYGLMNYQLSYIILKNMEDNSSIKSIDLGIDNYKLAIFIGKNNIQHIPAMFTVTSFNNIMAQETVIAAQEASLGNWVLGANDFTPMKSVSEIGSLTEQLRIYYVSQYIDHWEDLLGNIQLRKPKDLVITDKMLVELTGKDSPLIKFLQTLNLNTYFNPINSSSQKLQSLSSLLDKSDPSQNLLYELLARLDALHRYLQVVLSAKDQNKAAFDILASRIQNLGSPDAITQLRLVADKSPEPLKSWVNNITNYAWFYLMQQAGRYLDTSWKDNVVKIYQNNIANRYPFNLETGEEVEMKRFVNFFGTPGVLTNFYSRYLVALIDTSTPTWAWKSIENHKLPFSDEVLHQIQTAMDINHAFFPYNDSNLSMQFALQPYHFSKMVKKVTLNINDQQFIDSNEKSKKANSHSFVWPSNTSYKMTSVQFTMSTQQIISQEFPGEWGWFKLVNQAYAGEVDNKGMLINLSMDQQPVQYLLYTNGKINPFVNLNLSKFHLSEHLYG